MSGPRTIPADVVCLEDYERHFLAGADPALAAYVLGSAGDGETRRANRAAFRRHVLMPRALADVRAGSVATTLFGRPMAAPVIIAPTAFHRLVDPAGEIATVQAAAATDTWMCVSLEASVALEEVAAAAAAPLWMQLCLRPRRAETLALVRRAEAAGYAALVVTVDAPVSGLRNQQQRTGFRLPPGIVAANLAGFPPDDPLPATGSPVFQGLMARAPGWADIAWLVGETRLPVVLKGLLNPLDVAPALAAGAAGLIVSNHGGRTLDGLPASLDALPGVVAAVAGRVPVLMDGGIRRGTDIVRALALGAAAVLVGAPVMAALAVGGAAGVAHVMTILRGELEIALALLGRDSPAALDRSVLAERPPPG
ncbi:alpha-hydroxy acid oxidase [Pseudoxanthobacter sp.]|uniref:alpha-hydroxy acid oxidase n=1 Tax=Pseudoxanthobacter sp. TaxID=1925742 RepID=UPI002FE34A11